MTLRALLCLTLLATTPALAQERPRFGLEVGTTRWGSIGHDTADPSNELIPDQPTMVTARFTTRIGRVGLGLSIGRAARIGFASPNGPGFNLTGEDEAAFWELSPEVRVPLLPARQRVQLTLHAGLVFDKWHIKNFENRNRGGVIGGATASVDVGPGWGVDLRWDYLSGSTPFDPNEAGTGTTLDGVRRSRLVMGVSWRL
ncbi:MAG TPA: hypothetical protein VF454_00505 [Gemmatimonadales bacterium]